MEIINLLYGRGYLKLQIPSGNIENILEPQNIVCYQNEVTIVREALNSPIGSPPLGLLAQKAHKIIIVTSDITRPLPSKVTLPLIIKEIKQVNKSASIKVLVATGLHRAPTQEEMCEKFGSALLDSVEFVIHNAKDRSTLTYIKPLSSGNELWINKEVVNSDLVIAEGLIEPHFVAGFSGGPKSILPGVAGYETIMENHSAPNVDHPKARSGILEDNPVYEEMVEAAKVAGLKFILNVVLDKDKKIIKAFAGNPFEAHKAGCQFVLDLVRVKASPTDIVITSNNGYPLDRNLYQAVKGLDVAEKVCKERGVIILASQCADGIGHKRFYKIMAKSNGPKDVLSKIRNKIILEEDQWEAQILARILGKCTVIVVTDSIKPQLIENMHMKHATCLEQALDTAFELKGKDAKITVIPQGPVVIPM